MAKGSSAKTLAALALQASTCTKCALAQGRTQVVFGAGNPQAELLFVGEAPGVNEDKQGVPFIGASGKLLTGLIEGIGMTREDCYIANVVKCHPPNNRDPQPIEIEACSPWLTSQIELIKPKVVVTLGNFSTKLLLETKEGITKIRGEVRPYGEGRVLIPTFHPAAVLRGRGGALAQMRADFVVIKRELAAMKSGD